MSDLFMVTRLGECVGSYPTYAKAIDAAKLEASDYSDTVFIYQQVSVVVTEVTVKVTVSGTSVKR